MPRANYPLNAEDLARKHGRDGMSLHNLLRANPQLVPRHTYRTRYEIEPIIEASIIGHPGFTAVRRRKTH